MPQVQVQEVAALVAQWQAEGLQPALLDVREPWEVAAARVDLPGVTTLLIPMQQIPTRQIELPDAQPLLVLCHHGMRSLQVAMYLAAHDHDMVVNVAGGIDAWSARVDPAVPRY
ncbi:MAG: rhodanese-like domain-containing protein [Leptothrix sp. (in: b-proteobacteria)]